MGITSNDIAAQRAMIERGEEKRKADWKQAERERLRDTLAAAALTGLLSNIPRYQLGVIAVQAYDIADEMIAERSRTGQAAAGTPPQSRAGTNASETVPAMAKCTERENASKAEKRTNTSANREATPGECSVRGEGTLTDAEREAVEWCIFQQATPQRVAVTLRRLLERLT
jgi:hypothetical protein